MIYAIFVCLTQLSGSMYCMNIGLPEFVAAEQCQRELVHHVKYNERLANGSVKEFKCMSRPDMGWR